MAWMLGFSCRKRCAKSFRACSLLAAAVASDRCPICGRAGATVNLSPPQKSRISPTCRAVEVCPDIYLPTSEAECKTLD